VRGTSRREEGRESIAAAGIEPVKADPAQPGTVLDMVADVAMVVWLLGSAEGSRESIEAIHGAALERVLERLVETPVRRFVYEAAGNVDAAILAGGAEIVRSAGARWRIPVAVADRGIDMTKLGLELRRMR